MQEGNSVSIPDGGDRGATIAVWDWPVRIVHWSIVLLIPALYWSVNVGRMDIHVLLGQALLGLVIFRVLWGFIGSTTARFSHFIAGPAKILAYVRSFKLADKPEVLGHNPVGGVSTILLLTSLLTQASLGLFAQDVDAVSSGPLNHLVSWDSAVAMTGLHAIGFNVLLALIIAHIAAILAYRFLLANDLISTMVSGYRRFKSPPAAPKMASSGKAVVAAIIAALIVAWIHYGLPPWGAYFPWDQPADVISDESYM
jgi:cytochrome b